MTYKPDLSDLRMCNFQYLRDQALLRLRKEGTVDWTDDEVNAIGDIMSDFAESESAQNKYENDWRENEGLLIISRDLDELFELYPKWACLAAWLAPESPVILQAPEVIEVIAREAFKGTLHKLCKTV